MSVVATVPRPAWRLLYSGQDITADISEALISCSYTGKVDGESSQVEVKVEDRDRKWIGPWMPQRGDVMQLDIGYEGALASCGLFQVDECTAAGAPDTFTFKGIAAYIKPDTRTRSSRSYQGQTLIEIAKTVAAAHGLTVVGDPPDRNVTLARVTQKHETDLAFLRRMANLYGYQMTQQGQQLVFEPRPTAEARAAAVIIDRSTVTQWSFTSKTLEIYAAAEVVHFNPDTKETISGRAESATPVPTANVLKVPQRAESAADAQIKAEAALHAANMGQYTGKLTLEGNPLFMAGLVVTIAGFGFFDGNYLIEDVTHTFTRGPYTTDLSVRKVVAAA